MQIFWGIIAFLLFLYLILLIGRLVLDWVQVFARDWRPQGFMLLVAETVYTTTDPPLRALRKVIPPLRIGQVSLDLGFIILFIAVSIARTWASILAT
ncbi:YggT family protein [Paraoerskovia marina]|uniref:YggT family protein n=1 Tax=Paraoerskovia marina TaxID=545619 RepID=A0A1H1TPR2_9CELL|nr:YggT family protein [Paraoerskovia marina]SDS62152.1 YggT family protein [Paraoerskovia marina]